MNLWRVTSSVVPVLAAVLAAGGHGGAAVQGGDSPHARDDRLVVELFAEHPAVVTPTGLAVDGRGRVFVAESHTHFRPTDYDGPPADRILIFADADGDGRGETRKVFHEGFVHVMDIAFHHDGSLYVATRKDIHRLRDTDGDDRADEVAAIVRLETKGNYPHNGLSGIAFDMNGGFHFGLGENLGEPYTLVGSDERRITGGGEGGSTYWVDDDGKRLRRISTGWWNPYGMCVDSFGRVFGTDNDPDASPPCRLIQVVPDGDYGYEFRYGRSGRNPLTAWDGEIPGTLPMVAGTGEAPCHIVAYESGALPAEYYGHLLIPSWADHRIEHYGLSQRAERGLVVTQRQTLVSGGDNFRPVGIDMAPDGTVYFSDWVSSSYTLHKQGRIWRLKPRQTPAAAREVEPAEALESRDRRVRETAARRLAATAVGRQQLIRAARESNLPQARATSLQVLGALGECACAAELIGNDAVVLEVRTVAARVAAASQRDRQAWQNSHLPAAVRAELLFAASARDLAPERLEELLTARDPLLQHAAVGALTRRLVHPDHVRQPLPEGVPELGLLLAVRRTAGANRERAEGMLAARLRSPDPRVRLAAVKWVADEKLVGLASELEALLADPRLDAATFLGIHVALQRLAGQGVSDRPPPQRLVATALAEGAAAPLRRLALRLVEPGFSGLRIDDLARLLDHADLELRQEALWTIAQHPDPRRTDWLVPFARDVNQPGPLRATAVAGLGRDAAAQRDVLVELAGDTDVRVRDEALRSLLGTELTDEQRASLRRLGERAAAAEAVQRLVNGKLPARPAATDEEGWLRLLGNDGDVANGERIFRGFKVGTCSKCHSYEGTGTPVGPDLSRIAHRLEHAGEEGRSWLLTTILQPSRDMAPQFTPWIVVTRDGQQLTGLPRRKGGTSEAYLGVDGREFSVKIADIERREESPVSIMPADLLQQLTQQELVDLFAFLTRRAPP